MHRTFVVSVFVFGCATLACGGERAPSTPAPAPAPPSPSPPPSNEAIVVTGSERLEWDQPLGDLDPARLRFAAYVDSTRVDLPAATCRAVSKAAAVCVTPLPPMAPGRHELQLVARVLPANVESPRSVPIALLVTPASVSAVGAPLGWEAPQGGGETADCSVSAAGPGAALLSTAEGELRLVRPPPDRSTTLAWDAPGGGDWALRAAAAHPQFARNGRVYAVLEDRSRDTVSLSLVRYREVAGVLGERATLARLADVPDATRVRLRFGPDGRLYVALLSDSLAAPPDSGGRGSRMRSYLLRFNDDGTVPGDNPGRTPWLDVSAVHPVALAWDPFDGELWIVDTVDHGEPVARRVRGEPTVVLSQRSGSGVVGLGLTRSTDDAHAQQLWLALSDGAVVALRLGPAGARDAVELPIEGLEKAYDGVLDSSNRMLLCGHAPGSVGSTLVRYIIRAVEPRG
jgi:Glucose / Sorbosone dehydrogenase